jgi:hypothetical protein
VFFYSNDIGRQMVLAGVAYSYSDAHQEEELVRRENRGFYFFLGR